MDKDRDSLKEVNFKRPPEAGSRDFSPEIAELRERGEERFKAGQTEGEAIRAVIAATGEVKVTKGVRLSDKEEEELEQHIGRLKRDTGFKLSTFIRGNDTAAEYDCHVQSFSTQTRVVTLESGRKLFLVFNYPTSWIHRKSDALLKFLNGRKIRKADSKKWKETFERRAQIPTIPNSDPNTVVMDYIPNINLYDLFANRSLIQDFGECDFARDMGVDDLLEVIDEVVDKTRAMHDQGIQWGELNLPNIIIDKDREVHICDPETEYSAKVPVAERQARDLFVFIMSSTAALQHTAGVDHSTAIKRIIERYAPDEDTKKELRKLADKPTSFLQQLTFGYTQVNFGLKDRAEYEKIKKDIVDCLE